MSATETDNTPEFATDPADPFYTGPYVVPSEARIRVAALREARDLLTGTSSTGMFSSTKKLPTVTPLVRLANYIATGVDYRDIRDGDPEEADRIVSAVEDKLLDLDAIAEADEDPHATNVSAAGVASIIRTAMQEARA